MATKPMSTERLAEQKIVVEKALKSKSLENYKGVRVCGENSKILKAFMGELRNIHLSVFKKCLGKTSCEHCGIKAQLDRAHTKGRPEIALEVLDRIHTNPDDELELILFVREFILEHINVGVWMLCKKCHKELG
jgi:hypothetical protein